MLGIFPDELPTATILRFQIIWWYYSIKDQHLNVNSSIYVELLPPRDHIRFEGNIPIETTIDSPLSIQAPFLEGFVNYGVESATLSLYDTQDIPPVAGYPFHSQSPIGSVSRRNAVHYSLQTVDSVSNGASAPYFQQTIVFTELAKAKGTWAAYLQNLRDNTITKVVATSNGIYPRKNATLFLYKSPWDKNAPRLIHIEPTEPQTEAFPISFLEQIIDDFGSFNYGVDETSITFSYHVLNSQESWTDVSYSISDPNWSNNGNIYHYSLSLSGLTQPIYIAYYWSASDLADPANYATDGDQEWPYCIGIFPSEIEASTTTSHTSETSATTSTEPGAAIGFEFFAIMGAFITAIVILRRRRR